MSPWYDVNEVRGQLNSRQKCLVFFVQSEIDLSLPKTALTIKQLN